jgi:hypothetical protein
MSRIGLVFTPSIRVREDAWYLAGVVMGIVSPENAKSLLIGGPAVR